MSYEYTPCPFCKTIVEIDIGWAIRNGRVFCGGCCKSFEIRVGEEEKSTPPAVTEPEDVKVEVALEELEKSIDKAIEDYEIPDSDDYSWF